MAFNSQMHERNIYKNRPDFAKIALNYPEFRKYSLCDAKGKVRVDFTDPDSLRTLTKILLKKDFNLNVEIPKGFLIPTVPQRLNYILWIEDLLSILPKKNNVFRGIDIGCGPCAIFSILGARKNGWMFTATETSDEALQWALNNIKDNDLSSLIQVVKVESDSALSQVLSSNETYDFCLCNPPFFENMDDIRKKPYKVKETITTIVKKEEIFSEGGEVAFVKKIIEESLIFRDRVKLYTSMFGKKKSFVEIFKILQGINDIIVTKSQFCQGNTIRWGVAWTFDKSVNFGVIEKPKPKKSKKAKPPLVHHIPKDVKCSNYNVQELSKFIWNMLKDLKILIRVARLHEHYTETLITTDKNTWSHQRRRRREMRQKVENADAINLSPNNNNLESKLIITNDSSTFIKANENNSTTGISVVDNSVVQGSSVGFKNQPSEDLKAKIEDSKTTVPGGECVKSLDGGSKKRKMVEENSENCKKLKQEGIEIKITTSEDCLENLSDASKKRKLVEEESLNCKKMKRGIDDLKSTIVEICSESPDNVSKKCKSGESNQRCQSVSQFSKSISNNDYCDSNKLSSACSFVLKEQKDEFIVKDSASLENDKGAKGSEEVKNKGTNLIKPEEINDVNFEPKSLLFCILKIRRAKDFMLIEMNCPDDANRESMYQIFQYLKNKLR